MKKLYSLMLVIAMVFVSCSQIDELLTKNNGNTRIDKQFLSMKWATIFICVVFFVAGMLSILASVFNWHWFFESSNARMLTGKMTRRMARVLYAALGIAIIYMGSVVAKSLF